MNGWAALFGLSHTDLPAWLIAVMGLVCLYVVVILPSAAMMSFFDRKLTADLQARVGPKRVGLAGGLQWAADLLKLLQKGERNAAGPFERLWIYFYIGALFSTVAVLPLSSLLLMIDSEMSAFLPFWSALLLAFGLMSVGLSRQTVPGTLGGVRVASQALAGAFPALIAILAVSVRTGSFRWSELVASQGAWPFQWAIINPFLAVGFLSFMGGGMVLMGVFPLDSGHSKDLVGGVQHGLVGWQLALYRLTRFYGTFLWCVIAVILFLGGWQLPVALDGIVIQEIGEVVWVLLKTYALMTLLIFIARVSPRMKGEQVTALAWRLFAPLSLVALVGISLLALIGDRS